MTTFGARAKTVYLALESIAGGIVLPSRLILWVDNPDFYNHPPKQLQRLEARGLEIRLCEDLGPHKKYYPYVESQDSFDVPLVTADDDVIYPNYWLMRLVDANRGRPDVVNCYRARGIEFTESGFAEYETWKTVETTEPSFRHFAIGVGGVIYPVQLQERLRREGRSFRKCCPKADDIWLHALALREGLKVRQIQNHCFELRYIPGTQDTALQDQNVNGGGNDLQIHQTYRDSDLEVMRAEESKGGTHSDGGPRKISGCL